MAERDLTIHGAKVIAHAWEGGGSQSFDYSDHMEQIGSFLNEQKANNKPLLIVVVGQTGAGKTMLAKVLATNGSDTAYINCLAFRKVEKEKDFLSLLDSKNKTYLLDSPEFLNSTIWASVDNHVEHGGICVCFVQRKDDFQGSVDCKYLMLKRTSFTWE